MKERYWEGKKNLLDITGNLDNDRRRIENAWRSILKDPETGFSIENVQKAANDRIIKEKATGGSEEFVGKMEKSMKRRIDYLKKMEIAEQMLATGGPTGEIFQAGWEQIAERKVNKARSLQKSFNEQIMEIRKKEDEWIKMRHGELDEANKNLLKVFIEDQVAGKVKDNIKNQPRDNKNWILGCIENDIVEVCKDGWVNYESVKAKLPAITERDIAVKQTVNVDEKHTGWREKVKGWWKKNLSDGQVRRIIVEEVVLLGLMLYNVWESKIPTPVKAEVDKSRERETMRVKREEIAKPQVANQVIEVDTTWIKKIPIIQNKQQPEKRSDSYAERVKMIDAYYQMGPLNLRNNYGWEMDPRLNMPYFDVEAKANTLATGEGDLWKKFTDWKGEGADQAIVYGTNWAGKVFLEICHSGPGMPCDGLGTDEKTLYEANNNWIIQGDGSNVYRTKAEVVDVFTLTPGNFLDRFASGESDPSGTGLRYFRADTVNGEEGLTREYWPENLKEGENIILKATCYNSTGDKTKGFDVWRVVAFKTTGLVERANIDPELIKRNTKGDIVGADALMAAVNNIRGKVGDRISESGWYKNLDLKTQYEIDPVLNSILNPKIKLECDGFAALWAAVHGGVKDNPMYIGGDNRNPSQTVPEPVKVMATIPDEEEKSFVDGRRMWKTGKVNYEKIPENSYIFAWNVGERDRISGDYTGHVWVVVGSKIDKNGKYTLEVYDANSQWKPGQIRKLEIESQAEYEQIFGKYSAVMEPNSEIK